MGFNTWSSTTLCLNHEIAVHIHFVFIYIYGSHSSKTFLELQLYTKLRIKGENSNKKRADNFTSKLSYQTYPSPATGSSRGKEAFSPTDLDRALNWISQSAHLVIQ